MVKRIIVLDFLAGITILFELIILTFGMRKMGAVAFILLDALGVAIIMFAVNFIANKTGEGGSKKICIINAVVIVSMYIFISGAYQKTPIGISATEYLNEICMLENQTHNKKMDDRIEITFSDGNALSPILSYGFYLAVALVGGQLGIRKKSQMAREL